MTVMDIIESRNSIRKYRTDEVPDEMLAQVLRAARLAPSWRNQQCWRFIVLRDSTLKSRIIKCTSVFNQSWLGREPVLVVACGDPALSGSKNNQSYYLVDVAIAMEHLVLAATELGLGTCWIGGFEETDIKKLLHIPDNIRVVALTPLGFPEDKEGLVGRIAKKVVNSKDRHSIDSFVYTDTWGTE